MITDEDIEKAVDFLRDSAPRIGVARAELHYAEAMLRHVKALAMQMNRWAPDGKEASISAQEREAYASAEYMKAIEDYRKATLDFETLRALREGAVAKIEAWRSMSANLRGIRV